MLSIQFKTICWTSYKRGFETFCYGAGICLEYMKRDENFKFFTGERISNLSPQQLRLTNFDRHRLVIFNMYSCNPLRARWHHSIWLIDVSRKICFRFKRRYLLPRVLHVTQYIYLSPKTTVHVTFDTAYVSTCLQSKGSPLCLSNILTKWVNSDFTISSADFGQVFHA